MKVVVIKIYIQSTCVFLCRLVWERSVTMLFFIVRSVHNKEKIRTNNIVAKNTTLYDRPR